MKKYIKPKKILWMDLEMTGLDPQKQVITEVAAIITDVDLNELETYEAIIHHSKKVLDGADEWVKNNMSEVLEESAKASLTSEEAEQQLIELTKKHFNDLAVLSGNSIHQDRRFIRQHWPNFEQLLHYRMLDVSAWKVYMMAKFNQELLKPNQHRALEDIRGSIGELQGYLNFFEQGKSWPLKTYLLK